MNEAAASPSEYPSEPGGKEKNNDTQHVDFNIWPPDMLAAYIEKEHHRYIKEKAPQLIDLLRHLKNKGDNGKHLARIRVLFAQCTLDLSAHMQAEESVVFAFIKKMALGQQSVSSAADKQRVLDALMQVSNDHKHLLQLFSKIRSYSHNYAPLSGTSADWREVFAMLQSFEEDLLFHLSLEQHILFPKVKMLCNTI